MKKLINKSLTILLLAGSIASCNKDFIDKTPYTSLSPAQAFGTEADLKVALNGTYASMRNTSLFGRTETRRTITTEASRNDVFISKV